MLKVLHGGLAQITKNKKGIEIGGPSISTGEIIYKNALSIDNVVFSNKTIWANHSHIYNYYKNKKGKNIINDAIDISNIKYILYILYIFYILYVCYIFYIKYKNV